MFKFDRILQPEDSQVDTFKASSESLLKMALQGKNTCAFTYGASGSGKTYTIMGGQGEQAGVLPRTVSALFNCLDEKLGTVIQCIYDQENSDFYIFLGLVVPSSSSNSGSCCGHQ